MHYFLITHRGGERIVRAATSEQALERWRQRCPVDSAFKAIRAIRVIRG